MELFKSNFMQEVFVWEESLILLSVQKIVCLVYFLRLLRERDAMRKSSTLDFKFLNPSWKYICQKKWDKRNTCNKTTEWVLIEYEKLPGSYFSFGFTMLYYANPNPIECR